MRKPKSKPNPTPSPSPDQDQENACGIYQKEVKDNDPALMCDRCNEWIHIGCNKITLKQYRHCQEEGSHNTFECKNCCKCNICNKTVVVDHHGIVCNLCNRWVHTKCNKLDKKRLHIIPN